MALAMAIFVFLTVVISAAAGYMARQAWGEGQWEMAGIFAVSAAAALAFTVLLGHQMVVALRRKQGQNDEAISSEHGGDQSQCPSGEEAVRGVAHGSC